MKKIVRIGSRESKLAVWQAEHVAHLIEHAHPEIEVQIITMKIQVLHLKQRITLCDEQLIKKSVCFLRKE